MPRCWIGVGSNLDRESSIRGGLRDLRQRFGDVVVSPVVESHAVGAAGPPYWNLVVGIDTPLMVSAINALLRAIEEAHGRIRTDDKCAPRTLDLDLLTYGDQVGSLDGYQLPRDEILDYAFVLAPLAAVAPDDRHPQRGLSYAQLWSQFDAAARAQDVPRQLPLSWTTSRLG